MLYIIPTDTCFGLACAVSDYKGFERIYEIKGRDFNKPLAIMINDNSIFKDILNQKQISFLSTYSRPWTLLIENEKVESWKSKKMKTQFLAFRVANNDLQKKLINEVGPIYLTSANLSGKKEIYSIDELNHIFGKYEDVKILAEKDLQEVSPSDIFEFVGDTAEVKYLRKN